MRSLLAEHLRADWPRERPPDLDALRTGLGGQHLVLSGHDLALCLFLGVVQYTDGFVLITLGARYLPAAEVALLSLSETVLAPLWVWVGVGEVPALLTLAGGAIVLSAVVAQAVTGMRSSGGG